MVDDRPTLAMHLTGRSRDAVTRFLAALYDARGARTRRDGDSVVVDGDRYLVVPAGPVARLRDRLSGPAPSAVDAVIALDANRAAALAARYDAPALTPEDVDALARYGLDRSVADDLVRETLGVGLDELRPMAQPAPNKPADVAWSPNQRRAPPNARATRSDGESDGRSTAVVPWSTVAVGVLAVTLVAVLVVAPASLGLESSPRVDAPGSGASADTPGDAPEETEVPTSPDSDSAPNDTLFVAPGLTADGVADAEAVARGHVRALSNQSYTWELTYVASINGTERGRLVETVSVATPTRYVSTVRTDGTVRSSGPISDESSYADGNRRYRHTDDGYVATALAENETLGLHERRARQYYRVLLDGVETSLVQTVHGEPPRYILGVRGTPAWGVRNYTATAYVAPNNLVYYYSGSYCVTSFGRAATERCYSLTMRYSRLGETAVEAPEWYRATTPTNTTPSNVSSNTSTEASSSTPSPSPTDSTGTSTATPESATGTSTATPEPTPDA